MGGGCGFHFAMTLYATPEGFEEKRGELPLYEIDASINQFRHRLRKLIEIAG